MPPHKNPRSCFINSFSGTSNKGAKETMKILFLVVLSTLLLAHANAACSVQVMLTARLGGSWTDNGVNHQIYDIIAVNNGTDNIQTIRVSISFPPGNTVVDVWNYNFTSQYLFNFGEALLVGQTFNGGGFILRGNGPATLGAYVATCTSPPSSCQADFTLTKRVDGAWLDIGGIQNQIWDLLFRNTGTRQITGIKISIVPASRLGLGNLWNLVYNATSNLYTVQVFNSLYAPGSEYNGAGFVVRGTTTTAPVVRIQQVTCP